MTANVLCNLIITSIVSDIASKAFNSEHCRFETQLVTTGTAGCCHCNVPNTASTAMSTCVIDQILAEMFCY